MIIILRPNKRTWMAAGARFFMLDIVLERELAKNINDLPRCTTVLHIVKNEQVKVKVVSFETNSKALKRRLFGSGGWNKLWTPQRQLSAQNSR